MNPNSLVSIDDISREEIIDLIERARFFEEHPNHKVLDGKVVATLFLSPPHVHASASRPPSTVWAAV